MMGKQESLYLLVKSLNSSEKSAVRSGDASSSGYIALFEILSRQRQFDERKARKKLSDQGHDINYSHAKNYLTRHILRILRESRRHSGDSLGRQITELEILLERKIYALSDPLIGKLLMVARNEERFAEFLKLSALEIERIVRTGEKLDENLAQIEVLNTERTTVRRHLNALGELEDLYFSYQPISKRKRNARNQIDLEFVERFRQHALLQAEAPPSIRARRMYYKCWTHILAYAGDYQGSFDGRKQFIALFREHNFLLQDHPVEYLNELLALGSLQLGFGELAACEQTIEEILTFQNNADLHGSEYFDKYYRLLLAYAMQTGRYQQVDRQMEQIRAGLSLYAESLPWTTLSMLYFILGRIAFDRGQYADCRQWLMHILDRTNRGIREDLTSLARILTIFTHLEEGDPDLVESQSRATRKYLNRRDQLHRFESRILSYLEHHSFQLDSASHRAALTDLRNDLQQIFEDPMEATILRYFDIRQWLDRKLEA